MAVADPVEELDGRFSDPDAVATPWSVARDTIAATYPSQRAHAAAM